MYLYPRSRYFVIYIGMPLFDKTSYVRVCQIQNALFSHNLLIQIFITYQLISEGGIYMHIINPNIILCLTVYMAATV